MVVVFGTRLYGKVDQVPGVFYVATRFFHVQFVPLLPVGSVLIIDGTESDGNYTGASIGLSGKSVLFAYLRLLLFLGGIITGIVGVVALFSALDNKASMVQAISFLVLGPVMLVMWWFSYRWAYASEARALRLAQLAGIPPEVIVEHFAPSGQVQAGDEQIMDVEPAHESNLRPELEQQPGDEKQLPGNW
jgi:hypothetical protein